jgi:hypothetical protein
MYGIPEMWYMYTFTDLERLKEFVPHLEKYENGTSNYAIEAREALIRTNIKFETYPALYQRSIQIK